MRRLLLKQRNRAQKAADDKSKATFKAMKTAEGACGTLEDQEDEQLAAIGKLSRKRRPKSTMMRLRQPTLLIEQY